MVLDRPEIPLHTNGSENDIRCQVTKRKISGGMTASFEANCLRTYAADLSTYHNFCEGQGGYNLP